MSSFAGIAIVLIIAIAITVSCLILVLGVVCIKPRMNRQKRQATRREVPINGGADHGQKYDNSQALPPARHPLDANAILRENEYASMRLLRPGSLYDRENPVESQQGFGGVSPPYRHGMYTPSEHIYESPETIRRDLADNPGSPQYFDLDPQSLPARSQPANQPTCSHDNYCTCATGQRETLTRGQVTSAPSKPSVPSYNGNLSV